MFGRKKKTQSILQENLPQDLSRSFLKGIFYGLGMIVAFAIVVPGVVWFLGTFDWVPFLSDVALQVAERMQDANN